MYILSLRSVFEVIHPVCLVSLIDVFLWFMMTVDSGILQKTLWYIVPVSVTECVSGLARAVLLEPYSVNQKIILKP